MFSKIKNKKNKNCSLVYHKEFLYNRQTFQGKGLIITSKISTSFQFLHVHLITC